MTDKEARTAGHHPHEDEAPKNDLQALTRHMREHPMVYAGAVLFVLIVVVSSWLIRMTQESGRRDVATNFARALDAETPAEVTAALAPLAEDESFLSARAMYLRGESAVDARDYTTARATFRALRERYPEFEFLPDAVEALGFIEEDSGNYPAARGFYEEVATKWPDSPAAQRQPFNIGRCYESEENPEAAIESYREEFETFPGSTIAFRAQQQLNDLRSAHPDLFEDELDTEAVLDTFESTPDAEVSATESGDENALPLELDGESDTDDPGSDPPQ